MVLAPEDISKVVVLLDQRELVTRQRRTFMETRLREAGCECEVRNLLLGDVLWVARTHSGEEYVLDHIVERKAFEDFCSSIKSGHLEDQKQRMWRCPCSHRTVLVESPVVGDEQHYIANRFNRPAFLTSLATTQIVHHFSVHTTLNYDDTIAYLAHKTALLQALARDAEGLQRVLVKPLLLYREFDALARPRGACVRDVFAAQLLQLHRLPTDAAMAISTRFGNAHALWEHYQQHAHLSSADRNALLMDESAEWGTHKIGPVSSTKVAELFTWDGVPPADDQNTQDTTEQQPERRQE